MGIFKDVKIDFEYFRGGSICCVTCRKTGSIYKKWLYNENNRGDDKYVLNSTLNSPESSSLSTLSDSNLDSSSSSSDDYVYC